MTDFLKKDKLVLLIIISHKLIQINEIIRFRIRRVGNL